MIKSSIRSLFLGVGREILAIRQSGNIDVQTKGDFRDIVTRADRRAEEMIVAHIKRFYPGHRIRGEEGTALKSNSEYEWIIDPIDGTTNFANGHDFFGISAGLYKNGVGQMGIMYFPALEKLAYGIKGDGAFINGKRVTVKRIAKGLRESLIAADLLPGTENLFSRLRTRAMYVLVGGSFTVAALWFIEGKIAAYLHTGATPYDVAAARIIVEEAGGIVSGIKDGGINLNQEKIPVIFSSSENITRELRELLK